MCADISSLGVLLHERPTGCPPFESKTLQQSGIDESRRGASAEAFAADGHVTSMIAAAK